MLADSSIDTSRDFSSASSTCGMSRFNNSYGIPNERRVGTDCGRHKYKIPTFKLKKGVGVLVYYPATRIATSSPPACLRGLLANTMGV